MSNRASLLASQEDPLFDLTNLCEQLRNQPEIKNKQSIRLAARSEDHSSNDDPQTKYAQPGDDCAAIATEHGYQLLAMEGMIPNFVKNDPVAAGWSSVMANVSDIAAMGGRPTAIVNAYWHNNEDQSAKILNSIKQACRTFGLVFAGGHSSIEKNNTPGLAVAITGHANHLLSCHHVKAGQRLFLLSDLNGEWHGNNAYWDCTKGKRSEEIRKQWQIPADLADEKLVVAAKDISNGGLLGTLLMMLELTESGATLDLNALTIPATIASERQQNQSNFGQVTSKKSLPMQHLLRWLKAFQSFGFLLTVEPSKVSQLINYFQDSHLTCCPIGSINDSGKVIIDHFGEQVEFWDLNHRSLTDMGKSFSRQSNQEKICQP